MVDLAQAKVSLCDMQQLSSFVGSHPVIVGVAVVLVIATVIAILKKMLKLMLICGLGLAGAMGYAYATGAKLPESSAALAQQATERIIAAATKDLPVELRAQVQNVIAEKLAQGVRPEVLLQVLREQLTSMSTSPQAINPALFRQRIEAALRAAGREAR